MLTTSTTASTPAPRDSRRLVTKWAGWIILSGLLIGSAMAVDEPVGTWLALHNQPQWRMFARGLSQMGQWWMLPMAGGFYGAFCFFRRQPGRMRAAFLVTFAGLSTGLCATTL